MKKLTLFIGGTVLLLSLTGCKNTLSAVGDTAKGAGQGTVKIIQGVSEGVDHIGKGVKADLINDKDLEQ